MSVHRFPRLSSSLRRRVKDDGSRKLSREQEVGRSSSHMIHPSLRRSLSLSRRIRTPEDKTIVQIMGREFMDPKTRYASWPLLKSLVDRFYPVELTAHSFLANWEFRLMYQDDLDGSTNELRQHRKPLCEIVLFRLARKKSSLGALPSEARQYFLANNIWTLDRHWCHRHTSSEAAIPLGTVVQPHVVRVARWEHSRRVSHSSWLSGHQSTMSYIRCANKHNGSRAHHHRCCKNVPTRLHLFFKITSV
jgi:hypothetical protein